MGTIRKFVYKYLLPREVSEQMLAKEVMCDECYSSTDHALSCSKHPDNKLSGLSLKEEEQQIKDGTANISTLWAAINRRRLIPTSLVTQTIDGNETTHQSMTQLDVTGLSQVLPDVVRLRRGSFYIRQDEDGSQSTEQVGTDADAEGFERQYLIETEGEMLWFEYTGVRYGVNLADIDMSPRPAPTPSVSFYFGSSATMNVVTNHVTSSNQPAFSGNALVGFAVSGGGNGGGGGSGNVVYNPQTGITQIWGSGGGSATP